MFELYGWLLLVLIQQIFWIFNSDYRIKAIQLLWPNCILGVIVVIHFPIIISKPIKIKKKNQEGNVYLRLWTQNHFLLLDILTLCLQRQIYSNKIHGLNKISFQINDNFLHDLYEIIVLLSIFSYFELKMLLVADKGYVKLLISLG